MADILLSADAPISETIQKLDRSGGEIALIVDDAQRLIGTITDGDIRRGLLRGARLDDLAKSVMNSSPQFAPVETPRNVLLMQLEVLHIRQLPLVDARGCVVDLVLLDSLSNEPDCPNLVVLMAGGLGERLRPLTAETPKPMLRIGDKPILQTIIERFLSHGFRRFIITVNYLAQQIEQYFGDGEQFGAEIVYLREDRPLGTAGALSLLPFVPEEPFFVMNGDILTTIDFSAMLRFHMLSEAVATMGVNSFHLNVPYGVVEVQGERIRHLQEKPKFDFLVNSGIYVLSPSALELVPSDSSFDMPQLFETLIARRRAACAFPIHEHWFDIGRPDDFERAQGQFGTLIASKKQGLHRVRTDPLG